MTLHHEKEKRVKKCKPRHKTGLSDQRHDPAALFPTSNTKGATGPPLSVGMMWWKTFFAFVWDRSRNR